MANGRVAVQKRNGKKNDLIMTPPPLAEQIVGHYSHLIGRRTSYLDPCEGCGAFYGAVKRLCMDNPMMSLEINKVNGQDFFDFKFRVDVIISNPPYSVLSDWLCHSFQISDDVVYLVQTTSPFFTKRMRIADEAGFGIVEVYRVSCPFEWRRQKLSFGTGLAAVHWRRGHHCEWLTDGTKED